MPDIETVDILGLRFSKKERLKGVN